jgi:threonyl-tRNA synthetase
VAAKLKAAGLRVDVIDSGDQLGKRIRSAKMDKIPYVLVVGDDDVANITLGVNPRGGEVERNVPFDDFLGRVQGEIAEQLAAV